MDFIKKSALRALIMISPSWTQCAAGNAVAEAGTYMPTITIPALLAMVCMIWWITASKK